jgi:PHD/YefM family antitoxin component YafN of YafNO toxin-antitoxin module
VAPFQSLIRRPARQRERITMAARQRERITMVDPDEPSAVVISAEGLEDLEDALGPVAVA